MFRCQYRNNEKITEEYYKATLQKKGKIQYILALIVMSTGFYFYNQNKEYIGSLWVLVGIIIICSQIYYSPFWIMRRNKSNYQKQYGRFDVSIRIDIGEKIRYQIEDREKVFLLSNMRFFKETEHLLILYFPKESILIVKDCLIKGVLSDLRLWLKEEKRNED